MKMIIAVGEKRASTSARNSGLTSLGVFHNPVADVCSGEVGCDLDITPQSKDRNSYGKGLAKTKPVTVLARWNAGSTGTLSS